MALLEDICEEHPLRISQYYLSLIDMNDKTDPIRRLAIPLAQERHRGVWSLMVMVYILPLIKGEYTPDLDDAKSGGVRDRVGELRFSVWRGYQSHIKRDYGRVAGEEYGRYGARLFILRAILSGLLLLPISLVLIVIPPLAIFGVMLWIRAFSLNHKHFSVMERGLLILVTFGVAAITTFSFLQTELLAFNLFFDTVYGIGLLTSLILLFGIILRK
ncbi:hypothetical protein EU528_08700 [Candidatus Thorarchaeota archaeon]|nr:MAG: hypothetical protein EU528_08700 [Candidatus Thorarchaeota archaeon]